MTSTTASNPGPDAIEVFRRRVRTFFDETVPAALDGVSGTIPRAKAWRAALYDAGLAGLGYPVEHGGHGGTAEQLQAYRAESSGRIPPEDSVFGLNVGTALPTIRDLGSPELCDRFLRPGLRGDEVWCQLYSEPGAGSDLAALSTRAVRDGDVWVLNGQKVWTSGAQHSNLAIVIARTDPTAPKHRGITMFVLPLDQPGVDVRPLRQMTGNAEFNEVFLTDAVIPGDWVIGAVNDGWRMAVALLAHERVAVGTASIDNSRSTKAKAGRSPLPAEQLVELARAVGRADDPVVRQDLARVVSGERVMRWLGSRKVHPSIGKLWRTKQGRAAAQIAHQLALAGGAAWTADDVERDYWAYHILNCRAMSIGGGTDEVQRNTLGEKALGLPREPATDVELPFDQIPTSGGALR